MCLAAIIVAVQASIACCFASLQHVVSEEGQDPINRLLSNTQSRGKAARCDGFRKLPEGELNAPAFHPAAFSMPSAARRASWYRTAVSRVTD